MKMFAELEVHCHLFLTSACKRGERKVSRLPVLPFETNLTRGRVGLRADLKTLEKPLLPMPVIEYRFLDGPTRSLVTILTELY